MTKADTNAAAWVSAAAIILLITTGIRQSMGLFLLPIVSDTGLGLLSISFAMAIGQFTWGAAQPVFGAIADRQGAYRVLVAGGLLLAAGTALVPWSASEAGFTLSLGVLAASGAAAGSFAILIGVTSQHLPAHRRSIAAGVINAGGSIGQLVFAPLSQFLIGRLGWRAALLVLSGLALLTVPIAWRFRGSAAPSMPVSAARAPGLREQLLKAIRNPSYLCLHAGFFTCGFHVGFLVTHFPGDLKLCGLPATVAANALAMIGLFNIVGSISVGWLGGRYRMKYLLAWLYASRAAIIALYLVMPKNATSVYLVSAALGVSWLATVPPTAGLVGKLFGIRYLTTLFGLTLLSHQVGGFLGAWLGGISMVSSGSYAWMWYADMALALVAAAVNLPIRESAPHPRPLAGATPA